MALRKQVSPLISELLAAGFVRTGTTPGELFNPDGTPLTPTGTPPPPGAAVPDATDETDVVETVNALLASLRAAGFIAPEAP